MKTRMRWVLRIGVGVLVVWAGFAAWLLGTSWSRVPEYAPAARLDPGPGLMTRAEYAAVIDSHARPYVYEVKASGGGAALVFGSEHTLDPADDQLAVLRQRFAAFGPTVLLVEGRLGRLFPAFHDPVRMFGETGAAHELARAGGVPIYSWEPPVEVLTAALLAQGFDREQMALRYILNPYFSNLRHGRPTSPEAFVLDTLAERARRAGAEAEFAGIAQVDAAWRRHFPVGPDWRDVSDEYGLPGFLAEMDLNSARDAHLLDVVAELIGRGARVFVVCGCSHAVVIEAAVREIAGI